MCSQRDTGKKKNGQWATAQLGQRKLATKVLSADTVTGPSHPPANMGVDEMSHGDCVSAPQTESNHPSSPSLSTGQRRSPTSKNDRQDSRDITIPRIKLHPPEHFAIMLDQRNKAVTISSPTLDPRANRSTSINPTNLLHPFRNRSPGLPKVQQYRVMADDARNALQAVIEYCKQQPTGFLDFQEGMVLGMLNERLKRLHE